MPFGIYTVVYLMQAVPQKENKKGQKYLFFMRPVKQTSKEAISFIGIIDFFNSSAA
jgi:hypothetical protein